MKMAGAGWKIQVLAGVLAGCSALGAAAYAQNASDVAKDDLFAGTEKFAQGATGVNEISMDPDSLGLVNGDHARRAHRMVLNVVRTYEYDKPGMYRMEDVDTFRKKLETGDWRCSVHTRDLKHGGSTDVCNKRRTDGMVESAIITVEPKSLTFIHTIRRADDGQSRDTMPAISGAFGFAGPGVAQLAMIGPMLDAQMATLGGLSSMGLSPMIEANLTTGIAARMAALGPEMAARMAGEAARLQAMGPRLAAEAARLREMAPRLHGPIEPLSKGRLGDVPALPPAPAAPSLPKLPE